MSRPSNAEAVTQVLQQFTERDEERRLEITQIDVGSQAHIFTVQSLEQQPSWAVHDGLVVKLYKQDGACGAAAAFEQRDALLVLHQAIHGLTVHGWKIFVPEPLHVSEAPPALVMTMVPGRKLNLCLERGERFGGETMVSAAQAIASAMQRCWSTKVVHGDLAFHNILCDVRARTLSFVDAGALANCCKCEGAIRNWNPAVHDLAHILCDVSTNVKHALVNRGADARNQHFSGSLLRAYIESIGPDEEKRRMLDELRDCTQCHIRAIGSSISPHGLWHVITRWIALRRVDAVLFQMRTQISVPLDLHRERRWPRQSLRAGVPTRGAVAGEVHQGWRSRGRS
jgi:hypothetical protein